ncbi:MAG: nitroreductase [Helicobacteraceae bacterium]|jgi:nitroreductase|nr:nitroreductase [Helicobacteraceae bacterium]
MDAIETIYSRKSIREYAGGEIPDETLRRIVEAAARAPSSKNSQPWKLFLLRGKALEALRNDYLNGFDRGKEPNFEYVYNPERVPESYKARAIALGRAIFAHKGIRRDDTQKRRQHDRENFAFFGAPYLFILAVEKDGYALGTFFDCGLFFQNLMIAIAAEGLGSCPQFSAMSYPDILHSHIPESANLTFIAALPFGKPLAESNVNNFTTEREPIEKFFRIVDSPPLL